MALSGAMHGHGARRLCTAGALAFALGLVAGPADAQQRIRPGQSVSQPVVQALPNQDNLQLNAALSRLGRDPRDLDALIDAGNAALAMGDVEAASGFFKRANQVSAKDPRVKAGLGGALVRRGDPLTAIALFNEAEQAGAQLGPLAADRGLAYDLVGDNVSAQRFYRMALVRKPDDEVTRRLALSQAISGDRRGVEATLLPLLRQQDKAAWRTRTFALAILGEPDEAIRTARTILPHDLAESMMPYLKYMPQLTKAQQAAAANLGNFPRAAEVGRDDPRIAQYAASVARPTSLAAVDAKLVPKGEPLGRSTRSRGERQSVSNVSAARPSSTRPPPARDAARVAPPEPQPSREAVVEPGTAAAMATTNSPSASMSAPVAASAAPAVPSLAAIAAGTVSATPGTQRADWTFAPAPAAPAPATTRGRPETVRPAPVAAQPAVAAAPRPAQPVPRPGFDLARLPQSQTFAPAPAPVTAPAPVAIPASPVPATPTSRRSLADAFSDLGKPSTMGVPTAGAVDISAIKAAKPKAEAKPVKAAPPKLVLPKPAPPSHPSRIWVQLGIGRDKAALGLDWKKLSRQATAPFKGRKGYVSDMGQTNRMLAGPFASAAQANKFIAELRGEGVSGAYVWTSPAGQVVDTLPVR